jgi:hypothetical protein
MTSPDDDCRFLEEKACAASFLRRWRAQLLIHETEDDANAIELDRRVLDYYLDQYQLAKRQPGSHRTSFGTEAVGSSIG